MSNRYHPKWFVAVSVAVALTWGCAGEDGGEVASGPEVRDSAGVRIVTYPDGAFTDTVPPEPLLTIGREGEENYEFFRLNTVVSLASGNVVVANGGTHELRFFTPEGEHIRTVGRRGEGPGEFGFLSAVWVRAGDTLMVRDARRRRIVVFDSAGSLVRGASYAGDLPTESPRAQGPCAFPGLMGVLADGTRVISGWGCMMLEGSAGRRPTLLPITLVGAGSGIGLGESAGGWEVDVGEFTANRVWETGSSSDPRDLYRRIPFSGVLAWAVAPDAIHLADLEDYEIRVYEGRGRLSRILREDAEPPPVTAAHREAYLAEQEALDRPHPEGVPFPDRFGSYETFVVSHEGDLWARRVTPPEVEGAKWEVFPGDGGPLRRVILPDITVESVRDGRVYGHRSDSLGIQTVVVLDAGG